MYEYGTFEPAETAVAPAAYYILPEADEAIDKIEAHGLTVIRYATERELPVERFVIDSTTVAAREFQGHNERNVFGHWEEGVEVLPEGTIAVPVDQSLGRLALMLLEPRSDDGFANWALLDDQIEEGVYPILRSPAR